MNGLRSCLLALALLVCPTAFANSDEAEYAINGKHFDALDQPTYKVNPNGSVDWYTANGFQAYHRSCHSCHGPNGAGSDYGSALTKAVTTLRHFDFTDVVVNGQITRLGGQARVMPAFGTNPKVMCRLDAIYVYLRAEAAGVLKTEKPLVSTADPDAIADLGACLAQ